VKKFSSLRSARKTAFAYTPPDSVAGAVRALLIVGTVKPAILAEVLRGFWRLAPTTRLLVTMNDALQESMLGANMRAVELDALPNRPFVSRADAKRFVSASPLLSDVNLCITLTSADESLTVPPSLGVLAGLSPVPVDAKDAYFALGHMFVGAIVAVGEQVLWGDDLLDVDAAVYRALNLPADPMLQTIRETLKRLPEAPQAEHRHDDVCDHHDHDHD